MRVFGLEITKAAPATQAVPGSGAWWPLFRVREPRAGDWQRNRTWSPETALAHHAVYACVTLIASDVGKLRQKLVGLDAATGIWSEVSGPKLRPYTDLLKRPNSYQNHIQFKEWWITSKLLRGNTYAFKERDATGLPRALHLLDPSRVQVLVAPDGSVFYRLYTDNLSGLAEAVTVPASEVVHDRMNCLFHPLVGISPIFASGLAAHVGTNIEGNAADFFENGSNPSGILTAPANIPKDTAERLKAHWEANYSGQNSGRVAVLGDGLKFEKIRLTAVEAQMIEHLKWTAETVCSTFHVPAFKIGVGTMPTYNNAEILNQIYYSDCLQAHIESLEASMDEALGLMQFGTLGVELDLDALLRMDTATQIEALGKGVGAGIHSPDEARRKLDLPPVPGGDSPYLQQQNWSLADLARRSDAGMLPEGPGTVGGGASPAPADPEKVAPLAMAKTKQWGLAA